MARLGSTATKEAEGVDYSQLSLDDLHALQQRAAQEIETRRTADRDKVVQQIRELAEQAGIEVTIGGASGPRRRGKGKKAVASETSPRPPVPVKYQHPENKDLKWTGRGRKPAWVAAWEEAKGSLDGLAVG